MAAPLPRIGILHYSAPPVVGGVEHVIREHARLLVHAGFPVSIIAGAGAPKGLPSGAEFAFIPELGTQYSRLHVLNTALEQGHVPEEFESLAADLEQKLRPIVRRLDVLIVHNAFSKHFNLPLTATLFRLLESGTIRKCIAWCHDSSWTSTRSQHKVHPGYPWELLRTCAPGVTYVTVSRARQAELARSLACPPDRIHVVYAGVDAAQLLGLSRTGARLASELRLAESELNLIMPVRVTRAKNMELAIAVTAALKDRALRPRTIVTGPPDPHDRRSREYFQELLGLRSELRVVDEFRFVYENPTVPARGRVIGAGTVAELLRLSDAVFLPSHSEGYGIPILEAGLLGLPVFCSNTIPAATELASTDVFTFSPTADPASIADQIFAWRTGSGASRWRHRIMADLTWEEIFRRDIRPLLLEHS